MAATRINEVVEHLRRAVLRHDGAGLTDGQLLGCFIEHRDEDALAALVRRHGPLVWSVCRRVLGNQHDAEDAFQATFLVLVRRAASVVPRERVANWLYGVASQTAWKARATAAKRRTRERQIVQMTEPATPETHGGDDLHDMLHQALGRLPDKYRVAILLCDLEGKTRTEAARQLGVPEGTLASWLVRGRALLAKRLARHGLVVAAGALSAALMQSGASASVPGSLSAATMQAVSLLAAERDVTGVISTRILGLMEGVIKGMLATKIKMTTTVALAVIAVFGLGSGGLAYRMQATAAETRQQPELEYATRPLDTVLTMETTIDDEERLVGSGKEAKKEIKVADFNALDVRLPMHVTVTRGDAFHVEISADDNLLDIIKVDKEGSTLKFSTSKRSWQTKKSLKATITMPSLEKVNVSSASHLTLKDFKSTKPFNAKVSAASSLDGSIEAGSLKLDISGAGKAKLKGSTKTATLTASGASSIHLAEFPLDSANVTLTGACSAQLNVKTKLDYLLSGASKLHYQGSPTIGKKQATGASSVSTKKKCTRLAPSVQTDLASI